jgi:hypothetical protein
MILDRNAWLRVKRLPTTKSQKAGLIGWGFRHLPTTSMATRQHQVSIFAEVSTLNIMINSIFAEANSIFKAMSCRFHHMRLKKMLRFSWRARSLMSQPIGTCRFHAPLTEKLVASRLKYKYLQAASFDFLV